MFELITQIIILVGVFFLLRFVFGSFIPRSYLTWLGIVALLLIMALAFLEPTNQTAGILWGILSFPLRPIGLTLILMGYAFRFGIKNLGKAQSQILSAFLILLISSLPITAYLLTAQTEQRSVLEASQRPAGAVEAIVVSGDGTLPTDPVYRIRTVLGNPATGLSVALESRLMYAARLYAEQRSQGSTPLVIVSAGPQAILARQGVTANDAILSFLNQNGVPSEQVRLDNTGVDPRSTALAVREIFDGPVSQEDCALFAVCDNGSVQPVQPGGQRRAIAIVLVTPAISTRRSVSTFTSLSFRVTPRPTDFYVFQLQGGLELAALTDLIPNAEALAITTRVIDEYLSWMYYFVRGWLTDPLAV